MLFCHLDLMDLTRFFVLFCFFLSGPVYNHVARMFPQQLDILEADTNKLKPVLYPFKPRSIPT